MSVAQIIWPYIRPVLAAAGPNLLLFVTISINFTWWLRTGSLGGYLDVAYFTPEEVWLESVLTVVPVIALDILVISLFARRWRARRWGRKPPEIERSTRYTIG